MEKLSSDTKRFLKNLEAKCRRHGVILRLEKQRSVPFPDDGAPCNGYFIERSPTTLAVATAQPLKCWLKILVHESCHLDQWVEQIPCWLNLYIPETKIEALTVLQLWIDNRVELNANQIQEYVERAQNVELDCEKRAVKKIRKYNLPFDIKQYIQQANAYLYLYTMICHAKKWYTPGREPYNVEAIVSRMPTHFDNDYDKMPSKELYELYLDILK